MTYEQHGYPFDHQRGIDFNSILLRFKTSGRQFYEELYVTPSGEEIKIHLESVSISLQDKNRGFVMSAERNADHTCSFSLRTRRGEEVHPDFFATKFVKFVLSEYFKESISAIRTKWIPGSLNYDQFRTALEQGDSPTVAASKTWEAQIVALFGFTLINPTELKAVKDTDYGKQVLRTLQGAHGIELLIRKQGDTTPLAMFLD